MDDVALKTVLELKRQRNAEAKARQKKRRRKTLQDDAMDKPALASASIQIKEQKGKGNSQGRALLSVERYLV